MKFALFLLIVFTAEVAIMNVLPAIVPVGSSRVVVALVDAASLSVVIAPIAWWLFIVPLQRRHAERGRLLDRLLTAQEEERAAVVRDLHDGIGQSLTALLVRLQVLEQQTKEPSLRDQVATLRTITTDATDELRRMVRQARPPTLDDHGLCSALQRKAEELTGESGIQVDLDCRLGENVRLLSHLETAVYRMVVEAIHNAIKHAAATHIQVQLQLGNDEIRGEIRDDGRGFVVRQALRANAFGIVGIRERCEALHGRLTIESQPGQGTRIGFSIPCRGEECRLTDDASDAAEQR